MRIIKSLKVMPQAVKISEKNPGYINVFLNQNDWVRSMTLKRLKQLHQEDGGYQGLVQERWAYRWVHTYMATNDLEYAATKIMYTPDFSEATIRKIISKGSPATNGMVIGLFPLKDITTKTQTNKWIMINRGRDTICNLLRSLDWAFIDHRGQPKKMKPVDAI